MKYTTLGKTGLKVSRLGFGCMRLPMKDGKVVRELSTPMLRRAFDLGVNLFDSAVMYCGGDSQRAVGEALEPIRDQVIISTKNHLHHADPDDWWRELENSLRYLRTDHIDIYNHHGINWKLYCEKLDPEKDGLTALMLKAKEQGLIRHVAFSFHDKPEGLVKLAKTGYYESVILQYNLLDQANADAMTEAAELGMGIIVMGPVGGGRLGIPSEKMVELTGGAAANTVEAAMRFVWAHPSEPVALSGMQNMEMLEQNARLADEAEPFTAEQVEGINSLVRERLEKSGLYCSGCGYCLEDCPAGVQIPQNLDLLNQALIFGLKDAVKGRYKGLKGKAVMCVACGRCLEKCPQNIDIPEKLRETVATLDPDFGRVPLSSRIDDLDASGAFTMTVAGHNVSNDLRDIKVELDAGDGVSLESDTFELSQVKPFERFRRSVKGTFEPETRTLPVTVTAEYEDTREQLDAGYSFMVLGEGLDEDWSGGDWQEAAPAPEDFTDDADTALLHGLRFKLSYDADGLLLLADVKDDCLRPSQPGMKGSADNLELFLDGRRKGAVGKKSYEDGVFQVMLFPGTPGQAPAFHECKKDIDLDVSSEETDDGYRMTVRIPFASFCVEEGVPARIGFDLAANTANADGERVCQYIWAGTGDNWRDARGFRQVWLT